MRNCFKIATIVCIIALPFSVWAADKKVQDGYGMAGCGLGSMVIKDNTMMQIFAATTNGTSASQTFGISTGTSNCTADGVVAIDKEAEAFVEATRSELLNNIAAGNGQYLATLASLYGCNADSVSLFGQIAQKNFEALSQPNATPTQVIETLKSKLQENPTMVAACAAI
jgi:hypothetical protein